MGGKSTLRTRQKGKKAPTLAGLKKKAWKLLSELVRRSNADQAGGVDCYTCDGWGHWKIMQAGHAIPGRTGAVLFDEEIIRPQCQRCNIWMGGNYPEFTTKLIREYAESVQSPEISIGTSLGMAMDWWEAKLQASRQIKKWTRSELQEKIDNYKVRLNGL